MEATSVLAVSRCLNGHPLAISLSPGFDHDGNLSVKEIIIVYTGDPCLVNDVYDLETLFKISCNTLNTDSRSLHGIMVYHIPDNTPPVLFEASTGQDFSVGLGSCCIKFA